MGIGAWVGKNWFDLLQSAGIIGSLLFTAASLRIDSKVRRIENLFSLTSQHRDIWTQVYRRPELIRIFDRSVIIHEGDVTVDEEFFVRFAVLHLNSAFHAMHAGMAFRPDGLRKDVEFFFSFPVVHTVWRRLRHFQDRDFVEFVERNCGIV